MEHKSQVFIYYTLLCSFYICRAIAMFFVKQSKRRFWKGVVFAVPFYCRWGMPVCDNITERTLFIE